MNLILDSGNTRLKIAVVNDDGDFMVRKNFAELNIKVLKEAISKNNGIKNAILSSVKKNRSDVISYLKQHFFFIELNYKTKLPVKNLYRTKSTLGNDRISNACGATVIFPKKNILILDAGTCIKYDFVNEYNQYIGGSISPGIEMRYKALNHFTGKLPLLKISKKNFITGKSTAEAIISGVQQGVIAEAERFISFYEKKYPSLKIICTGGNAAFFVSNLKKHIFAAPDLTLTGLNEILNYNVR